MIKKNYHCVNVKDVKFYKEKKQNSIFYIFDFIKSLICKAMITIANNKYLMCDGYMNNSTKFFNIRYLCFLCIMCESPKWLCHLYGDDLHFIICVFFVNCFDEFVDIVCQLVII